MFELTPENAPAYLQAIRGLPKAEVRITPLGGGVSNLVLLVQTPVEQFVLKQSLGKLRVEQDWFSDRTRIFRECSAMRHLAALLPQGGVPDIVFEDRENCAFAMTAAPEGSVPWKTALLRGDIQPAIARAIGDILARIIREGHGNAQWRQEFGDQTVFDELRLDPYYRTAAKRHPDVAWFFEDLICRAQRPITLVHGDFSPKNFLVTATSAMAIDFEVIHFGDPAFDSGFLLNHLLLKSFYLPESRSEYRLAALAFWEEAVRNLPFPRMEFEAGTVRHLAGLLLARIDGKSPAEYIQDPSLKTRIRGFARSMMKRPPSSVAAVWDRLETA